MKSKLILLALCFSMCIIGNAQTRRPAQRTTTPKAPVKEAIVPPSANGKFKFFRDTEGFYNDTDKNNYVVISAPGKSIGEIKSSIMSSLSSMYSNPGRVISTLGDNIINVNGYAQDAFQKPFAGNIQYFSFNYNIKIEIKDGKIKLDAPTFSNVKRKEIYQGYYTLDTRYVTAEDMLSDLKLFCDETQQEKMAALFNAHINKIVAGLSSNSDW